MRTDQRVPRGKRGRGERGKRNKRGQVEFRKRGAECTSSPLLGLQQNTGFRAKAPEYGVELNRFLIRQKHPELASAIVVHELRNCHRPYPVPR